MVTSLPRRLWIRTVPAATFTRARTPSHLNSYVHPGPDGSTAPEVASIGVAGAVIGSHLAPIGHHGRQQQRSEAGRSVQRMRAIWKGAVSFGLVNIGVKMFSATEERDISFHQVRRSDGSRVRYKRIAEADGEEVAYADIAKGYPLPSGEIVVLTDEDFADLPLPSARVADVVQFVPLDQIDPIYYAKSYYLEPEQPAVKPYVLLREALESSGMVGLVKVAIRSREQLAVLRVRDGVIVLETMIWPDEVRTPDCAFLEEEGEVRAPN